MGTPHDAALGLPLVMTGPDSTRTLNRIVELGCVLEENEDGWWRVRCGTVAWHNGPIAQWHKIEPGVTGYIYVSKKQAIEEFANAPDPHDGTKPGPTTPCRTDAASSSNVTDAKHRAAIAYSKLLCTLTTQEQKDAACDYMAVELEVMNLIEGGV